MNRPTLPTMTPTRKPSLWQRWRARRRNKRRTANLATVFQQIARLEIERAKVLAERAYHAALPGHHSREMVAICDELLSDAHGIAYALHRQADALRHKLNNPFRA